ncbi:MAG: energy transducer TonB, partial [Acidobacteria bacterium]|nr:energy transducer TonB [Acidobacteriota bacterium]
MPAHQVARDAKLAVNDDAATKRLTVRLGPLKLPANSDHTAVAQPPEFLLQMPFDGWITAYHPRLVDAAGAAIPGRMLHHVAFWNTGRSDFLCPNKQEHTFGAGGEMNDWPVLPGIGYAVSLGEKIRINTMFHNPTDTNYPEAYVVVEMEYQRRGEGSELKSVYPAWFDVKECGSSSYDLPAGASTKTGRFRLGYSGVLLGVGGHLHDFGQAVRLQDAGRNRDVADLKAEADVEGRIRSMPIANFAASGGYRMNRGDRFDVTATYQNPGAEQPEGAMGIAVGYFLPDDDSDMAALRRPAEPRAADGKKPAKKKKQKQASLDETAEKARRTFEITEDIEAPVPLDQPRPQYSAEAREHRHEGVVVLRVEVGPDGRVSNVRVQNPLGMGL